MSTVFINGVVIQSSGRGNVTIINGKVIVDGKDVTPDSKEINVVVNGPLEKLDVDACNNISITGDVGKISTVSAQVEITGNVSGSVSTVSGAVECGKIAGSVSTVSGRVSHS